MKSGQVAWECSHDLSACIQRELVREGGIASGIVEKNGSAVSILELGCGKGLPSLAFLCSLDRIGYSGSVYVLFQDKDASTIESVTKPHIESVLKGLSTSFRDRVRVTYVACTWESLDIESESQDVVLSSECIYRSDLFLSHASVLSRAMAPDGVALIAGKRYYFGCGGGTIEFSDFLSRSHPEWKVDLVETFEDGLSNTREILSVSKS